MSALVSPVGGRACGTLSILKISTRRRYLIRLPVNGEVSGPFAWCVGATGEGDGANLRSDRAGGCERWLISTKARPARRVNAIAAPTAAASARFVVRPE